MNFRSDNTAGASEKVIAALIAANGGNQPAYGADELTKRVEKKIEEVFDHEASVYLVTSGTAANSLALACVTPSWGAVLCHAESHISGDECGGPEFFTAGCKLVMLPGVGCKVQPADVKAQLARLPAGSTRDAQPSALSISQATEAGTIYSCEEIAELAKTVHARGIALHMDGARFANALVTLGCTPAEMTWKSGVDILSFGATKNGCLAAEAVVFFDKKMAAEMPFRRKRSGHTLSKGRLISAQMEAYLDDGHWLDLAKRANAAAAHLEEALASLPGVRIGWERQANEVFPIIPDDVHERLVKAGAIYHAWSPDYLPADKKPRKGETLYRFVVSFRTTKAEIEALRAAGQTEPLTRRNVKARAR